MQFIVQPCFGKARARYLAQVSLDVRRPVMSPLPQRCLFLTLVSTLVYADTKMTDEQLRADQNRAMCVERGSAYACLMAMGYECVWLDQETKSLICTPAFQNKPKLKIFRIGGDQTWLIEKLPDESK